MDGGQYIELPIEPEIVEELKRPLWPGLMFLLDLLEHRALLRADHPEHPDLPEDQTEKPTARRHHQKVNTSIVFRTKPTH